MLRFVRLSGKASLMSIKVDNLFEFSFDTKRRLIILYGDIEKKRVDYTIKAFLMMGAASPDPVTLLVNSLGGDVYDTFAIYDIMQAMPCPIRTIAIGTCQSAAPLLVAAGTQGNRFSMPNCYFMTHESWMELEVSTVIAAQKTVAHYQAFEDRFDNLMETHSKLTAQQWKTIYQKPGDSYFDSKTALDYGIIDNIMDPHQFWKTIS
jgi:ATP-dependent Clp protease, protease subunit